jgi:hypothetical protein
VFHRSRAGTGSPTLNSCTVRYSGLKVEHHSFPKLKLGLRLLGPVTGSRERLKMSEKLPLILALGAAGKFAGMVVPDLTKRGANVRGFVRSADEINAPKAAGQMISVDR